MQSMKERQEWVPKDTMALIEEEEKLHPHLERLAYGELQKVYDGILNAVRDISEHLRFNLSTKVDTSNEFGEL
jgi:hypothetical protein